MKADDGSPIHSTTSRYSAKKSHRAADAPSDISHCPTQSTRRAMELICQRRSTVVRRNTGSSALDKLHESERGGSRNLGAVNVEAENVPSRAIHNLMPHARTVDQRGELRGLFDGNVRCGAIDPTAARQDAAVHVANGSNPAGHGDSGVTKNCGAKGDKAGTLLDKGRNESSNPQPDRLEGTCCLPTCVDNGELLVRDCGLNPNNLTMEPDGALVLDWPVAPRTARADPYLALRFVRIRGQDAFHTIKL
ncbi:hypothetical protein TcCL_NonESM04186, partial [Trypanosoma cruzi]